MQRIVPFVLAVAGLLVLGGIVAAQEASPDATAVADVPTAGPPLEAPVEAEPLLSAAEPPPAETPAAPAPLGRVVLRRADVGIRSFEPEETMAAAVDALGKLGAWVLESEPGRCELRVPADKLDAAIVALRTRGEVVREDVSSEDATMELAVLGGRIAELETSRRRVQEMLLLASTVADSLAVEQTLRSVTEELEGQQGRLRFLQERVELSPLTLAVSMRERPAVNLPRDRQPFRWVESYGLAALLR